VCSSDLLFNEDLGDMWRYGIYMQPFPRDISQASSSLRPKAEKIITGLAHGAHQDQFCDTFAEIDHHCEVLCNRIEAETTDCLRRGKIVGIVGGDHSVSLGSLRAYARQFENFGILHLDAHADLRVKYEGFTYSHASVMHHASSLPHISRIVQVGVRDFCRQEFDSIHRSNGKVRLFTDASLKSALFSGKSWATLCGEIIESLPDCVYVSFDIDGLDPALCPHTGTPVPGGLSFEEAVFLIKTLANSGRKIIGFDLVEIAGGVDSWDSIVGARLLYTLCCRSLASCIG
jgi:agmatinase